MRISGFLYSRLFATVATCGWALLHNASAQTSAPISFSQPTQSMAEALRQVAAASGWEIFFSPGDVAGLSAPALQGEYSPQAAVTRLLAQTSLTARFVDGTITVRGREAASDALNGGPAPSDIYVTGSRLRSPVSASKQIVLDQQQIRDAGQSNLGEAIRSLPQNFSGGTNPGIALGTVGEQNSNLGGGSALNLRGLGQDATLTLLNGRRLSYGSAYQAVDVSSIPLDAVDRIEVVVDGASAVYGSDAVGGVANIILKRDYEGLSVSARLSAATDGGYVRQQYSAVGGTRWGSGGVLLAYDFSRNSPVAARQRSYTSALDDSTTLWPFQRQHAVTASFHQDILPGVELRMDGLYSRRSTESFYAFSTTGDYRALGSSTRSEVEAFTLSPELRVALSSDWSATLQLVYGEDSTRWNSPQYSGGIAAATIDGCYCNSTFGMEANIEGRLLSLPAGDVRLALGGGYRSNSMDYARTTSFAGGTATVQAFDVSRDSHYGFAEIQVPLVSAAQSISFIDRLTLTGAVRYEDYPGMARVATPKLGLVYAPLPDIDFKASWGKSFKAPTLYQQYLTGFTWLYNAAGYGSGLPAGSTVLFLRGGEEDLTPERAQTWSVSASLHPRAMPGFRFDIGYFDVRYRDRIVQPIASAGGVLNNPIYADLITRNPTLAQQQAAIAYSSVGLQNLSGMTYNPANVVAVIDNRYANVAVQRAHGIDLTVSYSSKLNDGGMFSAQLDATFLDSDRIVFAGQGVVPLSGNIFNPPRFRGRGGMTYAREDLTLAIWLNHVGSVKDTRRSPQSRVDGQTSFDLNARYTTPSDSLFGALEFSFGIANLLNDAPNRIRTTISYDVPYDSTNYSPLGRVMSFGVRKTW